jgi:hypothetical protein
LWQHRSGKQSFVQKMSRLSKLLGLKRFEQLKTLEGPPLSESDTGCPDGRDER